MITLGAIVALQITFFPAFWPPRPEPEEPDPVVTPALGQARASDCQIPQNGGNLFGETAFVRFETGASSLSENLRQTVAAAKISQNSATARQLLTPFLNAPNRDERIFARVSLAYMLLRLGPKGSSQKEIQTLFKPNADFTKSSDYFYINALLQLQSGTLKSAQSNLKSALNLNPAFYNARVLLALTDLRLANRHFANTRDCTRLTTDITQVVNTIATVGACPLQLSHFHLAAKRSLPKNTGGPQKELMLVFEVALAFVTQNETLHSKILADFKHSDAQCKRAISSVDFGQTLVAK